MSYVNKSDIVTLNTGKLPPQAVDLEQAVLGAFLIDGKSLEFIELLIPNMFFKEVHQWIFTAISSLYKQSMGIDLLTVSNELRRIGYLEYVGGEYYLIQLTQMVSSSAHIEFHIRIICQKYVLRELIRISNQTIVDAYENDPDIFYLIENIEREIVHISNTGIKKLTDDNKDLISSLRDKRNTVLSGKVIGIELGLEEFDEFSQGVQPGDFMIIAARPGMGKTTFAIVFANKMSYHFSYRGAFFSLEMTKSQLLNKIIAQISGIDYQRIRTLKLSEEEFRYVEGFYQWYEKNSLLRIYDEYTTLDEIIRVILNGDFQYVFIDYLQLIKLSPGIKKAAGNREQEVSEISKSMKIVAKKAKLPIIALAQLSRALESRVNKRPMLSDLRESGSLEQDADIIAFIFRQGYYDQKAGSVVSESEIGNTEFIVAKGREIGERTFNVNINFRTYELSPGFRFNNTK